ncbi:ribosomal RNA large subunit methyltransferase N [Globomyces pollinis-pini]|nr:ribosomal RNA large subunit methyltransferase N [Globomyces pollinis-pini]
MNRHSNHLRRFNSTVTNNNSPIKLNETISKEKINILGLTGEEISNQFEVLGLLNQFPKYTINQLQNGLYINGYTDFNQFTSLKLSHRQLLNECFIIDYGIPKSSLISTDGTRKWLLNFGGRNDIESVYIPQVNQLAANNAGHIGSLCVSSQVGCSLACKFCHTGTQKFQKNLNSSEIVAQILFGMRQVGDLPKPIHQRRALTNVVFMGQGEPLYNFKNVSKAIKFINTQYNWSPWRTTISTSGLVPLMGKIGSELSASLAVSLHAVTNELRDSIVPINKQYPIEELMKGCQNYLEAIQSKPSQQRRITFEYVMLEGVNDSLLEAKELVRLMRHYKIPAHFNLIPFNTWPGTIYKSTCLSQIKKFQNVIKQSEFPCHIRVSRGLDIMAACGQLKSLNDSKTSFTAHQ